METQLAETPSFPSATLDALPPAEIARKAAAVGEAKVAMATGLSSMPATSSARSARC
jgi:hypothetical protein